MYPRSTASPDLEPIQLFNNTDHSYLFAIREVKKAPKQVVGSWNYKITYSIVQNNCSKEDFLFLIPDCKSLLNSDISKCTDNTYMDLQLIISSFSQKCVLYPGEDFEPTPTRIFPGCLIDLPVDSPELDAPLTHSIAKFNAENNGTFYFKTDTVKSATVQMVTRTKFSSEFLARETMKSNEKLTKRCEANKLGQILG